MNTLIDSIPSTRSRTALTSLKPFSRDWFQFFMKSGCVVSSEPGRIWIGWGDATRSAHPEPGSFSLFAPDFLISNPKPWFIFPSSLEVATEELIEAIPTEPGDANSWNQPNEHEFTQAFREVAGLIESGQLLKAVPFVARTLNRPLLASERVRALRKALSVSQNSPMFGYGFWTSEDEGMIGATPEFLFRQTRDELETMALAGTRPVNSDRVSLLNDPKERLEHQFVIDGIVQRLTPFGEVKLGETTELQLPTLIHLLTPIRVEPQFPLKFSEAVAALHPTPAIGAWPLEAGWNWLRTQPNATSRARYGAPFGFVPPSGEEGQCLVAIRNVQWTGNESSIHAGCGVVGPSKLDRELREIHSKLDAIQQALGL